MVGLLNINKPSGMTSRRVVDFVAMAHAKQVLKSRVVYQGGCPPTASNAVSILSWTGVNPPP